MTCTPAHTGVLLFIIAYIYGRPILGGFYYIWSMLDYLVVGLGLAGVTFCHTLEKNKRSFKVITDRSQRSSWVAGGLYNPVILKRFKSAWRSNEQMELLRPFYKELEEKLGVRIDYPIPVLRRFVSAAEQNLWFEAADRSELNPFMSLQLRPDHNPAIEAPFGYGEVLGTGRIDTKALVDGFAAYLEKSGQITYDSFVYNDLDIHSEYISYGDLKARRIVFATGFGLHEDPYFNYLPLQGTKGELLTLKIPGLNELNVIKSSVFIIPLKDDLYRIGATYKWKDKTNTPTTVAREELLQKLGNFLKLEYEVVDHIAGIRPTVTDRRPLIGCHPENHNMYVLNGFGSRGVMIGPYASQKLYNLIEEDLPLPSDMDIIRFEKFYKRG